MSKKSVSFMKRLCAVVLSALMVVGITPIDSILGIESTAIKASAAARTLNGNEIDGYYINMSEKGEDTLDLSDKEKGFTFKVYDDGGANKEYSSMCKGYLTLIAPKNLSIGISGTLFAENSSYDYLCFFDGEGKQIYRSNNTNDNVQIEIESVVKDTVKIYFESDSGTTYAGFDLTVTLFDETDKLSVNVEDNVNGTVTVNKSEANICESITVNAVPNEGYVLDSVSVTDSNGNKLIVNGGH